MLLSKRYSQLLRGYRSIKLRSRVKTINDLFYDLANTHYSKLTGFFLVRKYINKIDYSEYFHLKLNNIFNYYGSRESLIRWHALILSNPRASLLTRIPPEWHSPYEEAGFKINRAKTYILWKFILFKYVLAGFIFFLRSFIRADIPYINGHYIVLPNKGDLELFDQYLTTHNKESIYSITTVRHSKPTDRSNFIHDSTIFSTIYQPSITYLCWGLLQVLFSFFSLFSNSNDIPFSLRDRLALQVYRLNSQWLSTTESCICEFLFSVSNLHSRPLYSYFAHKSCNIPSSVFFYSRNNIGFSDRQPFSISSYIWGCMHWDNYYLLGQENLKYISLLNNPSLHHVSSSTHYYDVDYISVDSKSELSSCHSSSLIQYSSFHQKKPQILVFDVTPRNSAEYALLLESFVYYNTFNSISFIEDILKVFSGKGFDIVLYRKKPPKIANNKRYDRSLKLIQSRYSSFKIQYDKKWIYEVQSAKALISYPFTTTAYHALQYSKPSIFYDPTNSLHIDSLAKGDIELVRGIYNLDVWSRQFFAQN